MRRLWVHNHEFCGRQGEFGEFCDRNYNYEVTEFVSPMMAFTCICSGSLLQLRLLRVSSGHNVAGIGNHIRLDWPRVNTSGKDCILVLPVTTAGSS